MSLAVISCGCRDSMLDDFEVGEVSGAFGAWARISAPKVPIIDSRQMNRNESWSENNLILSFACSQLQPTFYGGRPLKQTHRVNSIGCLRADNTCTLHNAQSQ